MPVFLVDRDLPGTGSHRQILSDLGIDAESPRGQELIKQWNEQETSRPGAVVVPPAGADRAAAQQPAMRARQALEDAQQEQQQEAIERALLQQQRDFRAQQAAIEAEQRPRSSVWVRPDEPTPEDEADEQAFAVALAQSATQGPRARGTTWMRIRRSSARSARTAGMRARQTPTGSR